MKRKLRNLMGLVILLAFTLMMGCGGRGAGESWAYIHETDQEILWLGADGKAEFKGEAYDSFEKDDTTITLKKNGTSLKMRYVNEKDKMLLYEISTYVRDGEGEGLTGVWKSGRSSFEFTDKGTFCEDQYLPGQYLVDEEKGLIKLIYNDHFEDTYIYFSINGNEMRVEYPWPMVATQEKQDASK